jgi:polyhydroxybutyrate depolymerase
MVDDIYAKYNVDPKRIFLVGLSNGAFMAHRLACDDAARVASIVSLAGGTWTDATKCNPKASVSILDVHGTADMTVPYDGGVGASGFLEPSEMQTMATWAQKNGCTGALAPTGETYDVDTSVAGNETVAQKYSGCPAGIDLELWTMQGSGHIPLLPQPQWGELVWTFVSAHAKP